MGGREAGGRRRSDLPANDAGQRGAGVDWQLAQPATYPRADTSDTAGSREWKGFCYKSSSIFKEVVGPCLPSLSLPGQSNVWLPQLQHSSSRQNTRGDKGGGGALEQALRNVQGAPHTSLTLGPK